MTPIKIQDLDEKRFNVLAAHTRSPGAHYCSKEIAWYSNQDESILGIILLDTIDKDFVSIVLGMDENKKYRSFDLKTSIETQEEAYNWIIGAMKWHTGSGKKIFPQNMPGKGLDLFTPIVSIKKQHPYFVKLTKEDHFFSAKSVINRMMPHFEDVDGNFVEQFQSTGFDSRLWELYLFSYFSEENLFIRRDHHAPDFMVMKYGKAIAIEAVIVGRKNENAVKYLEDPKKQPSPKEIMAALENSMPIKFGSPLYSKLKKEYWKLDHVKEKPLVFAIADFHDDQSMVWSSTALIQYLYGFKHEPFYDSKGNLIINPIKIKSHKLDGKEIPSGYFFQTDTENISAVLSSASGTISKFNRLGRQAGFTNSKVIMTRMGSCHDHDPNSIMPKPFKYEVNENSSETWVEGLSMFHNPNALYPVSPELFPSIAHHYFDNGQIKSYLPDFHPYSSITLNVIIRDN